MVKTSRSARRQESAQRRCCCSARVGPKRLANGLVEVPEQLERVAPLRLEHVIAEELEMAERVAAQYAGPHQHIHSGRRLVFNVSGRAHGRPVGQCLSAGEGRLKEMGVHFYTAHAVRINPRARARVLGTGPHRQFLRDEAPRRNVQSPFTESSPRRRSESPCAARERARAECA
jgi:hypothetical protein